MTAPTPDWLDQAAEQARRLLAGSGLGDTLAGVLGADRAAPAGEPTGSPAGESADCRWCPVCRGVAALREHRPDLLAGLADVLATTADVLRSAAGAATADGAGTSRPTSAGSAAGRGTPDPTRTAPAEDLVNDAVTQPAPVSPVQRIDVA